MQRSLKGFLAAYAAVALAGTFLTGCRDVTNVTVADTTIVIVNGNNSTQIVSVGTNVGQIFTGPCGAQTATVNVVTSGPAGAAVTITALTPAVATVSGTTITAVSAGTARFRVTVNGTSVSQEFDIIVSTCPSDGGSISFAPQNPSGAVGTTLQLQVQCTIPGCAPYFISDNPGVVLVDATTGLLHFRSVGTANICVQPSQTITAPKFCGQATSTAGTPQGISPANSTITSCAVTTFTFRNAQGNPVTSGVTWTVSGGGSINASGVYTPSTNGGPFVVTATVGGVQYTTQVTVTGCSGTTPVGILPANSTIANCAATTFTFRDASGNVVPSGVTWSVSGGGSINATTGVYTPSVNGGPFVVTAVYNGASYQTNVTVTGCSTTSPTISPANSTISNCAATTFVFRDAAGNPVTTGVTWSVSGGGSINSTSGVYTPSVNGGPFVVTATVGGVQYTTQVTVSGCGGTGPLTVSITPNPFGTLVVGSAPITLTCTVGGVTGTQSTACTNWTVSNGACATVTQTDANHATLQAIAGCTGTITVTAAAVANTSITGSTTGTTSSGTVTCTITWNGTTTGTITVAMGSTTTLTGSCTNQFGAQFIPYWYSADPSIARIQGATTTITIGTTTWPAGPQATLNGTFHGNTTVTMQAAITDQTVLATRAVNVP